MSDSRDPVWEHGENIPPGWRCKYCHTKRGGGGATRLKQHLAARGKGVTYCNSVPPDVREFFCRELDRIKDAGDQRKSDSGRRVEAARVNYYDLTGDADEEEQMEAAIAVSRQDENFRRDVEERGGTYEHGGGSGSAQPEARKGRSNPITNMLRRATSHRESPAVRDYNLASAKAPVQPRIDTGFFTKKGKQARQAIGESWARFFFTAGIPGRNADNPYFVSAVRETQKWGESVPSPTGNEIDGKYLDSTEKDVKKQFDRFKKDWDEYGVTIMCDSWTGPTSMSVINFLIYCNGIMFFHKSIDATGQSQDANFVLKEIRKVVREIGSEHVVQIITYNGSNYKKACRLLRQEYKTIVWQPCVAHTVNLMLKEVGKMPDHEMVIESARKICRWLYNHNKLHAMMVLAIGGELVKWNATRFGTNYMFLQSFLRKRDLFMQWMASSVFMQSKFSGTLEGKYAHACLSSLSWWENLEAVVNSVQPMYSFLRFADEDKNPNLSEVLLRYQLLKMEYDSLFANQRDKFEAYMEIVNRRMHNLTNETLINAAAALNPRTHYAYSPSATVFQDLRQAFEWMTDIDTAAAALLEVEMYRRKTGEFGRALARRMAIDGKTSPAQWWSMFASDTPNLKKLALRLVGQCCSSSGCERNWSTFAFVHTKVRNRLTHKKLNKLVYVNYNLRLRIQQANAQIRVEDDDPLQRLADLSFYETNNHISAWMDNARSNACPELDEDSAESDAPLPSQLVSDLVNLDDLRRTTGASSIAEWADTNVGDTHIGKRKTRKPPKARPSKKVKGKGPRSTSVDSDEETQGSPEYQESNDSSSRTETDDGDDDGEGDFTHATQDQDHGAPSSQRTTIAPGVRQQQQFSDIQQDSSSSFSASSFESGYPTYVYNRPQASDYPATTWVYEWQEPQWYAQLYAQWQTTSSWTGQSWEEYKAGLLHSHGLMLMSTEEYNMAYNQWNA
ncbi:uncharacterized protein [Oryza sativa Japonica Group]|uniref:uncharacterized protein n=1 Tax=Oryza sativa subsp. japonica TaxID=39947 RepID=UPI00339C5F3B